MMNAVRVSKFGGPEVLKLLSIAIPKPQENQVLIRVAAAGINPVDTYLRSGNYSSLPELPFTPGHDASGVIHDIGPGVTTFKPGDRVFTFRTVTGSYAEYAVANIDTTFPLLPRLSFEQGAALGVPYFTAYRVIMQRAKAVKGETMLVHGASGAVGLACCQLGKAFGLQVFGTASTESGRSVVKDNGADVVFDHSSSNYIQEIKAATENKGVNIIVEMLANKNLESDLELLSRRGRVLIVGSRGKIEIDPRATMGKESAILGVALMTYSKDELKEMAKGIQIGQEKGYIKPVVDINCQFELKDAADAHKEVISHREGAHGKLIFKVSNIE